MPAGYHFQRAVEPFPDLDRAHPGAIEQASQRLDHALLVGLHLELWHFLAQDQVSQRDLLGGQILHFHARRRCFRLDRLTEQVQFWSGCRGRFRGDSAWFCGRLRIGFSLQLVHVLDLDRPFGVQALRKHAQPFRPRPHPGAHQRGHGLRMVVTKRF